MAESLDGRSWGSVSSSWVSEAWMGPGPGVGREEQHRHWACEARGNGENKAFGVREDTQEAKLGPSHGLRQYLRGAGARIGRET